MRFLYGAWERDEVARCGECGGDCRHGETRRFDGDCTCEWGSCHIDGIPYRNAEQQGRGRCDECDNRAAHRMAVKP